MKYETATFRIQIDECVVIEVSITGCATDQHTVRTDRVRDAGKTLERIARAVRRIQQRSDAERGRRASQAAKAAAA